MTRLLVTGGSGFVGRSLLDLIGAGGRSFGLEDVVVSSRSGTAPVPDVKTLKWDVSGDRIPELAAEFMIHAATPADAKFTERYPQLMLRQIVSGARNVVTWSARQANPPRILFTSSGAVYGEMPKQVSAWDEKTEVVYGAASRGNAYAEGKKLAEAVLMDAHRRGICRLTVARLFSFSGRHLPLDRHFALGNFVRDALKGESIEVRGSGGAVRSYLDGDDLAHWLLTALTSPLAVGKVIHVGSEVAISTRELADFVAERAEHVLGRRPTVNIHGLRSSIDGYDRYVPSTSATKSLLGVSETVGLAASIDDMFRFWRAEFGRLQ